MNMIMKTALLVALVAGAASAAAATFGTVIPVAGHAADIRSEGMRVVR